MFGNLKALMRAVVYRIKEKKNNTYISISSRIGENVSLEGDNYIGDNSSIDNFSMGKMSYIASGCSFSHTKIGRFCSIAPGCKVIFGNHPTRDFVSTHPSFYCKQRPAGRCYVSSQKFEEFAYTDEEKRTYLEIGNDVWIATDVTIIGGTRIGNGAVIASGSLVTEDVPDYAVVSGIPAKVRRYRFNEDQIRKLNELEWWNKSEEWLMKHAEIFEDIERFLECVSQEE